LLGETGFQDLAMLNHARASQLADRLATIDGLDVVPESFFNEFAVRLSKPSHDVVDELATRGILAGVPASRIFGPGGSLDDVLLIAASELTSVEDMDALAAALTEVLA
jgi:glycine dehydrogenase subunit 1